MIKHRQESIVNIRQTLLDLFLQFFQPEVKFMCKPIIVHSIHLKDTPLYFVGYPDLVTIIILETNFFSSTKNIQPRFQSTEEKVQVDG